MARHQAMCMSARGALRALACALATAAALVLPLSATAAAAGGPALTVRGTVCTLAGSDAEGNQIDGGIGVVANKVENGNWVILKCTAGPGTLINLSGRTQVYEGFQCFIRSPVDPTVRYETFDTKATVTVNGAGQASCKYSKR